MAWNRFSLSRIAYGTISVLVLLLVILGLGWMSYFTWLPPPNNYLANQGEYQEMVDFVENAGVHEFIYAGKPISSYSSDAEAASIGKIIKYMDELGVDNLDSRQPAYGIQLQLKKWWWSNKVTQYLYDKGWIDPRNIPKVDVYERFNGKWIRFDYK